MKKTDIQKLKIQTLSYMDKWENKGGKVGGFFCPHCNQPQKTTIPNKKDVTSKGYWDSLTCCYECGGLFMSYRYPNGNIETVKPD
jgi:hypothetical protein